MLLQVKQNIFIENELNELSKYVQAILTNGLKKGLHK